MIEDKTSLVETAERKLKYAKKIVEENSELFEECIKYHDLWLNERDDRDAYLSISDNYVGVNLDIHLAENDSIDDFNMFLDEIPHEVLRIHEYEDGKWIKYSFNVGGSTLHVFCKYGKSKHCKLVETGETKPIYKRVCV